MRFISFDASSIVQKLYVSCSCKLSCGFYFLSRCLKNASVMSMNFPNFTIDKICTKITNPFFLIYFGGHFQSEVYKISCFNLFTITVSG